MFWGEGAGCDTGFCLVGFLFLPFLILCWFSILIVAKVPSALSIYNPEICNQFLGTNALQWHYLLHARLAFSCSFHFANPSFCLASSVIQVKLEKLHADGLLDFSLVHPATGFVCVNILVMVWIYWPWNRWSLIFLFLIWVWQACYQLYGLKILTPHCPLLKNNCFAHPSVLETTRISSDRILQCNCLYSASCNSWWSGGIFCIKLVCLSTASGENQVLGHRKTNPVFTPRIYSCWDVHEQKLGLMLP